MRVFTEEQWHSFPKGKKGHVRYEWRRDGKKCRLIGMRTLVVGNQMLIEGVHFRIDESLV